MQLYLVRHGETEWNRAKRYYGSKDIALNINGIQQAKQVGQMLKAIPFEQVYISPLTRVKQTWTAIYELNRWKETIFSVKETRNLAEQSLGIFEGFTYQELEKKFPEELNKWNQNWKEGAPKGESFQQLSNRVIKFCSEELELKGIYPEETSLQCRNHNRKQEKILIVSHEGVLRCFCMLLLKMRSDAVWNFTFAQGAYSRIDVEDGIAIVRKINENGEKNGFI